MHTNTLRITLEDILNITKLTSEIRIVDQPYKVLYFGTILAFQNDIRYKALLNRPVEAITAIYDYQFAQPGINIVLKEVKKCLVKQQIL